MKKTYGPPNSIPDSIKKQLNILEFDKHLKRELEKMRNLHPRPKLPSSTDYEEVIADIEKDARDLFKDLIDSGSSTGPAYEYLKNSRENLLSTGADDN